MLLPGASNSDAALLQRLERMERRMEIAGTVDAIDTTGGGRAAGAGRSAVAGALPAGDQPRIVARPADLPPGTAAGNREPVTPAPTDGLRAASSSPNPPGRRPDTRPAPDSQQRPAGRATSPD